MARLAEQEVAEMHLNHRDLGDPAAPAVVILHGIMGHRHEWDVLSDALAREYRVIAVDQRGHGRSPWAGSYTVGDMAGDLEQLLDDLRLPSVRVVGHSMGGLVGLLAADRDPERIEQLVLVDIAPDSLTPEQAAMIVPWLRDLIASSYTSVEEATDAWLAANPLARRDLVHHYVDHCLVPGEDGRLTWCFDGEGVIRFVTEGVDTAELTAAAGRITCPTLVIRGEHSPVLSRGAAQRLASAMHACEVAEIPGGGHDLGIERPEDVAAAILPFFSS